MMLLTVTEVEQVSPVILIIISAVSTALLGIIIAYGTGLIKDLKKNTLEHALTTQQLSNIIGQVADIKACVGDIKDIKLQVGSSNIIIINLKEQFNDIKKQAYDNARDIVAVKGDIIKTKDDIGYIFKELKSNEK